jgi:tRNA(Arg) A34 adenosine deaminase TadA
MTPQAGPEHRKGAATVNRLSSIPRWLAARERDIVATVFASDAARMAAVIALAEENVRRGGGPFGAAVFDWAGGRCVAVGVNRVVAGHCSHLHAEMVALARAQRALGTHDLATAGRFVLFASVEPCAMCLGAVVWSGVARLVCGATGADAEAVGFDEGPKPADWTGALARRGIRVRCRLLRPRARAVLRAYAAAGGLIYNASLRPTPCGRYA